MEEGLFDYLGLNIESYNIFDVCGGGESETLGLAFMRHCLNSPSGRCRTGSHDAKNQ